MRQWIQVLLEARIPPQGRALENTNTAPTPRAAANRTVWHGPKVLGGQVGRSRLLKVTGDFSYIIPRV